MDIDRFFARISFSGQKKISILRQLQRLIGAGVSISTSLDMLYDLHSKSGRKPKQPLAFAVNEWRRKLGSGKPLATCLGGWINPAEQMIIEAGEQSNKLSTAFSDALEASIAGRSIRKAVIGGISYPIVMLIALSLMLYGFSTSIVPTFATIVPPEQWTGNAAIMYVVSNLVTTWVVPIGLAAIALTVVIAITMPRITGPLRTLLDRVPPWSLYKVIAGASFMISLRGFILAGVTIPDALRRIARTGTPYMQERVNAILHLVNSGKNLGVAMSSSGHNFPDNDISGEISIYAGLDGFAENLDVLAKEWIGNSVQRTQQQSKLFGNVVLVILALTIAFIASSMFELQEIITRAAQA